MSGPDAWQICSKVFTPWSPEPFHARYGKYVTGDDGLALPFAAGKSFTGEESCELSLHGSRAGIDALSMACIDAGARLAEPGEFTLRAFLNGKIDLSQAEAVRDTVEAQTALQLRTANAQRSGQFSQPVRKLRARIMTLLATVEAHVDFSEELGDLAEPIFLREIEAILADLEALAKSARSGRILRAGYRIAIIGPPNAGKSSLLNSLLGFDRSIVTPLEGTTRDTVEESLDFAGLKVVLTDTAGLRSSNDPIERLGIERSKIAALEADHVWLIFDSNKGWDSELEQLRSELTQNVTIVANKCDLVRVSVPVGAQHISCITKSGLEELIASTRTAALSGVVDTLVAIAPRHLPYLSSAIRDLEDTRSTLLNSRPSDLLSVSLRQALHELGGITGESVTSDILDQIFHDFCIGK